MQLASLACVCHPQELMSQTARPSKTDGLHSECSRLHIRSKWVPGVPGHAWLAQCFRPHRLSIYHQLSKQTPESPLSRDSDKSAGLSAASAPVYSKVIYLWRAEDRQLEDGQVH